MDPRTPDQPSVLDLLRNLQPEDLPLPPSPDEMYSWGRLRRVLWYHPTALLEVVAGGGSVARGVALLVTVPGIWYLAAGLALVGGVQVWAVTARRMRLRFWAALVTMVLTGVIAAGVNLSIWQGYIGVIVIQGWIVIRSGPLLRGYR